MASRELKTNVGGEDFYQVLKQDHRTVADLFEKIEETSEGAGKTRTQLFSKLRDELLAHAHAEQEIFYTTLLDRVDDRDPLLEAFEEHGVVEKLVADIEGCEPDDERWLAKVVVLKELVEHHVEEEENEIFKTARKELSKEEALELGRKMQASKTDARP